MPPSSPRAQPGDVGLPSFISDGSLNTSGSTKHNSNVTSPQMADSKNSKGWTKSRRSGENSEDDLNLNSASSFPADLNGSMSASKNLGQSITDLPSEAGGDVQSRVYEQSEGEEERLPKAVLWVLDNVFKPCFREDEPFDEFIRKVAVMTYSVMASAGWMLIAMFVIIAEVHDAGYTPLRINMICIGIYMMAHHVFFNYVYIRRTQTCPLWLADIASVGAILGMGSFAVATLEADTRVLLMSTLLLTAMTSSPRFVPLALGHAAVYVFHYLRQNYAEEIPQLQFSWDRRADTTLEKSLVFFVLSIVPSTGLILGMYTIIMSYIKRSEESRQAASMTVEVANLLQRYDTAAVSKRIQESIDVVDPSLLLAFENINSNLENFKPHIPQYLIQEAIQRANETSDVELPIMDGDRGSSAGGLEEVLSEGDLFSNGGESSAEFQRKSSGKNKSFRRRGSMTSITSASSATSHLSRSATFKLKAVRAPPTAGVFNGQVTTCYLRLHINSVSMQSLAMSGAKLNQVLEDLNTVARDTKASLHYVAGDALFASWNATARLGMHEIRGCEFALGARAAIHKSHTSLVSSFSATVLSHPAITMFAGKSQAHFLVLGGGHQEHSVLQPLADETGAIVCNMAMPRSAETRMRFMGFSVDSKNGVTYELVEKKGQAEKEDEWMYELEAQSDQDHYAVVTEALRMCTKDNYEDAAALLAGLPDEVRRRPTTMKVIALATQA